MKSLICEYIRNNPNTWEQDFENMQISIKQKGNLCLFKYLPGADFYDPIVCEARGIIIDITTLGVVCIGFNKFFNHHEPYAAEIDWDNCKIQDKKDGSIIKLFYYNDKWNFATNYMIDAEDAEISDFKHKNYLELIKDAINYKDINYEVLNKDYTYIFELVDPIMHPVKYDCIKLYHIGTRNNKTLEELIVDIGIEKPEEYDLHSLEEVISFVESMNKEEVTQEGVVVVDKNWNRIKIKNITYLQLHYLNSGIITNKEKIIELLHADDIDVEYLIQQFPQYEMVFNFYMKEEQNLEEKLQEYLNNIDVIFNNVNGDRKQLANYVKNDKWKYFAFKYIDTKESAKSLLEGVRVKNMSNYCKLIPEWNSK